MLPLNSETHLGLNQTTYCRLRQAVQAVPPHQIWVAVCDDLPLQRQIAATLDALTVDAGEVGERSSQLCLAEEDADVVRQVLAWHQHTPSPRSPYLQILGIEHLTHQPSEQQYQFLASLARLVDLWPRLDCSLLIWLPRPWLQQIRRTVLKLWNLCQSTVFEFLGDPTPLTVPTQQTAATLPPPSVRQWQFLSATPEEGWLSDAELADLTLESAIAEDRTAHPEPPPTLPADLWQRLSADLAELEDARSLPALPERLAVSPEGREAQRVGGTLVTEANTAIAPPAADSIEESAAQQPFTHDDPLLEAHRWRDLVEAGDRSLSTLQTAIRQYENIPPRLLESSTYRAEALNDLGSLYWLLAERTADPVDSHQYLTRSRQCYEAALTPEDSDTTRVDTRIRLHSNLGSVCNLLALYETPEKHFDQAIRAFHHALRYLDAAQPNTEYLTLQMHLGAAYWNLAQHQNKAILLHRAIAAYQAALQPCKPHEQPTLYGQLQNNLGIALWSLARYERPIFLLEQAIAAYRNALAYRTLKTDPSGYAATHNNLGTAYWDMGTHAPDGSPEQVQAWKHAIGAYSTALSTIINIPEATVSFDRWATHHSLGVVHSRLAVMPHTNASDRQIHLNQAFTHYVQALDGWHHEEADATDTALQAVVQNLKLQAQYLGLAAQQRSLNQIPAHWLPPIWHQL